MSPHCNNQLSRPDCGNHELVPIDFQPCPLADCHLIVDQPVLSLGTLCMFCRQMRDIPGVSADVASLEASYAQGHQDLHSTGPLLEGMQPIEAATMRFQAAQATMTAPTAKGKGKRPRTSPDDQDMPNLDHNYGGDASQHGLAAYQAALEALVLGLKASGPNPPSQFHGDGDATG